MMKTETIDLSKYAANPFKVGQRVKAIPGCQGLSLRLDEVYTVMALTDHLGSPAVLINGDPHSFRASRFVPLEAEAPAIVCPNGCGSDPFGHCRACGGVPPVAESAKTYSCARCGVPRALQAQDVCADCALLLGWEAPVAESEEYTNCTRCGAPRSLPCGSCADCELLEQVTAIKVTKADPYELSRCHLKAALDSATPELDVGYETQCLPGQRAARERMVKALRLELDQPLSARRLALAKRFGGREVDDWGIFSTATEES